MTGTDDFVAPPIIELVLGAQFSPLTKLTAGHFGLLWKELGEAWIEPGDGMLIEDQFERFDQPKWKNASKVRLQLGPVPLPGRFTLGHVAQDRLLQVQATRFHLNWRKRQGFYPSYVKLIAEFEATFAQFTSFVESAKLGSVAVNQWELTYVDAFPKDEYWETPADWSKFLPGLFGNLFSTESSGIVLDHRAAEWSYEIVPKMGRLSISAVPGRSPDKRDALLLHTTARGPVGKGGAATLREGLDLGHEVAFEAFKRLPSEEAMKKWRGK